MDNNYQSPNIVPNHNVSCLNWLAILLTIMANISQVVELGLDIAPYIKLCPRQPMEVLEYKIPECHHNDSDDCQVQRQSVENVLNKADHAK